MQWTIINQHILILTGVVLPVAAVDSATGLVTCDGCGVFDFLPGKVKRVGYEESKVFTNLARLILEQRPEYYWVPGAATD